MKVSETAAKKIAAATDVTKAQAASGFRELQAPTVLAGLGPRDLAKATGRTYLSSQVTAAGHTSAADTPTADDMVAGGNLLATESTGDIVFGGLGTITSVCNDRVVGFGHPMEFAGNSSYGMAGADALYIQGDSLGSPFKVANLGDLLGTIDQDRMTGISGPLGPVPDSTPVTSTVTYHPASGPVRTRTGSSDVQLPDATAAVTFYEFVANHQKVLDAYQAGSEAQSWTVKGHTSSGSFTFKGGNRYADSADISYGSSYDLPDLLFLLTNVGGVTVDSVNVTSDVVDDSSVLKIVGADQRRGGSWHALDTPQPATGQGALERDPAAALRRRHARTGVQGRDPGRHEGLPRVPERLRGRGLPVRAGLPAHPRRREEAGPEGRAERPGADRLLRLRRQVGSVRSHQATPAGGKVITGHLDLKVKVS